MSEVSKEYNFSQVEEKWVQKLGQFDLSLRLGIEEAAIHH